MAETVGVIPVRIARGDLIDALGSEVAQRMGNRGRMLVSMDSGREALGQPDLAVDAPPQEGAKVGRQGPTLKISPHRLPSDRRTAQLFWARRLSEKASDE
jgi:hypothetical protein